MRHQLLSSRASACAFICGLVLLLALLPGALVAQTKKSAPPPPPKPAPKPAAPLKIPAAGGVFEQKLVETGLSRLLNDQLPLKLDAEAVYPTVAAPPGGPFAPRPLTLTAADLDKPLAPGDYTISMLAFCTEYSVHRPGAGIAYRLGPLQGKAAGAVGALLWRGTLEKNKPPQQLQAVSWAIQSGLRYSQMPKSYQALIDEVIPDHGNELNGDFMQSMEDAYQGYAKGTKLPPLDQMFAKMGKPGELALSARKQRDALLRQNTTDQIKEQTLFAGQESGVYKPVRAEEGPWTERIPGVAYLRYKIVGGNLATNNLMEIRILPQGAPAAKRARTPRLIAADYKIDAPFSATLQHLFQGSIGCAVGQGAQCLIPVPYPNTPPKGPVKSWTAIAAGAVGAATNIDGNSNYGDVEIRHNGVTKPLTAGTPIYPGDVISMGGLQHAEISFLDGTQIDLGSGVLENITLKVENYNYDQNTPSANQASFSWSGGALRWLSGAMDKRPYVSGLVGIPVPITIHEQWIGSIGIRGTEFIAHSDAAHALEIDLIHGALDVTPKQKPTPTTFTGPVKIVFDRSSVKASALTQAEYDARKAQLFFATPHIAGGRTIPMPPNKTK
jgi:hypothetical protein